MIAELSTSSMFLLNGNQPAVGFELTLRMEVTQKDELDACELSIKGTYEPKLPEQFQDEVQQALWDGVHNGLSVSEMGLPDCVMAVRIIRLVINKPDFEPPLSDAEVKQVTDTVRSLVAGTVASLWQSLNILSDTGRT